LYGIRRLLTDISRLLTRAGISRCLVLLVLVFACLPVTSATATAETRKLKLYFLHTGERAEITFKKNGKYVKSGLKKINNFLRDWRRNEPTKMNPRLLDLIWEVYQETGSRKYIHVISAYRSPATNSLLRKRGRGVARKSQHTLGNALDFFIPGVSLTKLRNIGLRKGIGGVGYYPKSGSPFVHMDTGRVRHWPRMSRRELVRVFPRGRTLHVPTDGKPLPGYNIAKANYERKIKGQGKITIASAEEIERKPGLLAQLFSRDEDEEGTSGAVAAPKAVRPTVVKADPEPTPETAIAALNPSQVPVPVLAPRIAVVKPPEPEPEEIQGVQETQIAALPTQELPVELEAELALNVPVPSQRPEFAEPVLTVTAEAQPAPAPRPAVEVAALSPNEIADLRQQVYATLESDATQPVSNDIASATRIATNIPFQPPTRVEQRIPFDPPTQVAEGVQQELPLQVDDRIPFDPPTQLEKRDVASLIASAPSAIDRQVASIQPIEPGTQNSGQLGVPEPKPQPAPQLVTALLPEQSSLAIEAQPETSTATTTALNIPVPQPAVRPAAPSSTTQVATAPTAQPAAAVEKPLTREEFQTANLEARLTGKWALAADASIKDIANIKPPAYGRNILRGTPSSVLSRGFSQDPIGKRTTGFSGSSLEFLDFKRFQ